MFNFWKPRQIEKQIEQFVSHIARKWPLSAMDYENDVRELVALYHLERAEQITPQMVKDFEEKTFNEHTSYLAKEAKKHVLNFCKYWGVDTNEKSLTVKLTDRLSEEQIIKAHYSRLGIKSWNSRVKKYGKSGAKKLICGKVS